MMKNLKVYFISLMIALGLNMIPVILDQLRIVYKLDVLHIIAIIIGVISIVVVIIFVKKSIDNLLTRIVIILLNPAVLYTTILIIVFMIMISVDWGNTWHFGYYTLTI